MPKKRRKAPACLLQKNAEAIAAARQRALLADRSSCADCIAHQRKKPRAKGRPKGAKDATPRKRSRECDLLKDDADWLSTTPDPLSKKQRAEDSQSFSPGEFRYMSDEVRVRDPFRKHTNYMRSKQLIDERLEEVGKTLSARDHNFLLAIGQLTQRSEEREIVELAWQLDGFDLMAKEVDELHDCMTMCTNWSAKTVLCIVSWPKQTGTCTAIIYHTVSLTTDASDLLFPLSLLLCCSTVQWVRSWCTLHICRAT